MLIFMYTIYKFCLTYEQHTSKMFIQFVKMKTGVYNRCVKLV